MWICIHGLVCAFMLLVWPVKVLLSDDIWSHVCLQRRGRCGVLILLHRTEVRASAASKRSLDWQLAQYSLSVLEETRQWNLL